MKNKRSISLFVVSFLLFPIALFADSIPLDIDGNGVLDANQSVVTISSNFSLPAGEYFFNDLVVTDGATLTLLGDPNSPNSFKGVKINAVNLTISSSSSISADKKGYGPLSGPGTPLVSYTAGASYGGIGYGNNASSTYGSAITPLDLGSGSPYKGAGGGAVWIVVTNTFTNDGAVSSNGDGSSSGGSIYVNVKNLSGQGLFRANGGGYSASSVFIGPGGGGRVALYYENSTFTGGAEANSGCGSLGMGYSYTCAGNGTVGFFDITNNNFYSGPSWRFQKNNSPFLLNKIFLDNGSTVETESDVSISANEMFVDHGSLLKLSGGQGLSIPKIKILNGSSFYFLQNGTLSLDDLVISGNSNITTSPEVTISIKTKDISIESGSFISVDSNGYGFGMGPGAPTQDIYFAGASYGGVGVGNYPTSVYGSSTQPTDFGSAGFGYNPFGGGAIRIISTGNFINNGRVSADGTNTSSGGSIYVTTNNLSGDGIFRANGGGGYCPNSCFRSGGGGRIALYYQNLSFAGVAESSGGIFCYYGCAKEGGDGTVVIEEITPVEPVCTNNCFSNVLFIPGLEASRLYEEKNILGSTIEDQLWEPNTNSDVEDLYLNSDGESINTNIYTKEIIEETNTPFSTGSAGQNIYKNLSDTMDGLIFSGYIVAWQSYPYDWRDSVEDIVDNGTKNESGVYKLQEALEALAGASKSGKVTIIAHSNGGLIAKALIKKLQEEKLAGLNNLIDKIDTVILVASPQLGTPTAIPAILHGYDQDLGLGLLLKSSTARELGRNMPGAYGLLPSTEYFNHITTPVVNFVPNILDPYMSNEINIYGQSISTYSKLKNYLTGSGGRIDPIFSDTLKPIVLNSSLLSQAENLHDSIDSFVFPSSIRLVQVAGWGLDTVAGFQYSASTTCSYSADNGCTGKFILDQKPIFTIDGDKTVVSPSALAMSGENYYVNLKEHNAELGNFRRNRKHKDIFEVNQVEDLVSSIIKDQDPIFDSVLTNTKPIDTSNRLRLSVHSPVTLDAYDTDGNHTGKVCSNDSDICFAEENIPNSSYYEFGEGKYINLPEENLDKIVLQGTGIGVFTFESELVSPNGEVTPSSFIDIPVTTETIAEVVLNLNTNVLELKLDVTGDGLSDFTINPSESFDLVIYLQIMRVTIDSFDISKDKKESFNKKIDKIIKSLQKEKTKKTFDVIQKFKSDLEKVISKPNPKKPKPEKISKIDAQLLLDMLNNLLDNLE